MDHVDDYGINKWIIYSMLLVVRFSVWCHIVYIKPILRTLTFFILYRVGGSSRLFGWFTLVLLWFWLLPAVISNRFLWDGHFALSDIGEALLVVSGTQVHNLFIVCMFYVLSTYIIHYCEEHELSFNSRAKVLLMCVLTSYIFFTQVCRVHRSNSFCNISKAQYRHWGDFCWHCSS